MNRETKKRIRRNITKIDFSRMVDIHPDLIEYFLDVSSAEMEEKNGGNDNTLRVVATIFFLFILLVIILSL